MHPLAFRYASVWIEAWGARSAAGDAAATWRSWRSGRSALDPGPPPLGRVDGLPEDRERILALSLAAARPLAAQLGPEPVLALSASKGDTQALFAGNTLPPAALLEAIPGALAMRLARSLGIGAHIPVVAVAACSTGLYGLLGAADELARGRATHGLAGAVDASLQPFVQAGFARLGVLATAKPNAFTGDGTGFAPAEGAGFFRLAKSPGPWRLLGGVRLGDACHPTRCADPAALRRCLDGLWELLPEPDLIVPHATGTRAGDAYEWAGLQAGPWRAAQLAPLKPVIGHCLGASGAVELAAALESRSRRIWKISLGFGGHIAGVAVERNESMQI